MQRAAASYIHEAMHGVDVLAAAGRALYGDRWHTSVARDLGTTYRTVRNWLDGRHPTPNDLEDRLRRLLAERRMELDAVLGRIDIRQDESRKQ